MKKLTLVVAILGIIVWSVVDANAQTPAATPTTIDAKTAKEIAKLENQLAVLKAKLPVVKAKGDIEVAEAQTEAAVDIITHAPGEDRKDRAAARPKGCGFMGWNCLNPMVNMGGSYGYGGSYDGHNGVSSYSNQYNSYRPAANSPTGYDGRPIK